MAATRVDAVAEFDRFVAVCRAKYPKAVEKLTQEASNLLTLKRKNMTQNLRRR